MLVVDLRQDFYKIIIGKRVLVLVNYDVDGICATKILQSLFKHDNILYSLVPTSGLASIRRAYDACRISTKHVIFLNCGGCIDLVENLQPEEDALFFVCDSHRPMDVCNVYSNRQVYVLIGSEPIDETIPSFDSIFGEIEGGSSDIENNEIIDTYKSTNNKDIEYQKWKENRDRLIRNYLQYTYYGRSSSIAMFELAWKTSKDSLDLLWWAIVGNAEQSAVGKVERSIHVLGETMLQGHVNRLNTCKIERNNSTGLKITLEKDLSLTLLQHWSIYDSLKHTSPTASKLKLWTSDGEKKLRELLVDLGIPLTQSKLLFGSMDLALRHEFKHKMGKIAANYGMPEIIVNNFFLQYGYSVKFNACDYVYAMIALLINDQNSNLEDRFLKTLDCLSLSKREVLYEGIEKAKSLLPSISRQIQISLEMNKINAIGPFLYHTVSEENLIFAHPYGAWILAKSLLNSYAASSISRKNLELPLIHCCVVDIKSGVCLLVGLPPLKETSGKNYFGQAFQQAAKYSGVNILQDFFDKSVIQIRQSNVAKFLDALSVLIE